MSDSGPGIAFITFLYKEVFFYGINKAAWRDGKGSVKSRAAVYEKLFLSGREIISILWWKKNRLARGTFLFFYDCIVEKKIDFQGSPVFIRAGRQCSVIHEV